MPMQSTLSRIVLTISLGTAAALVASAGPAAANGRDGGGPHLGGYSGGFVNTIHPIFRNPIVNTIHPIVRNPIVNTIHPIFRNPIVNTIHPIVRSPIINTIHPIIATPPIVRDHRIGVFGYGCFRDCPTEGGLPYGQKPALLPYGYQLPQGGQVRDHRS